MCEAYAAIAIYTALVADRVIIPKEMMMMTTTMMMMMLGWPAHVDLRQLSDAQIRELAGESMGVPCVVICMAALSFALPGIWSEEGTG